jgi:leucyl-tRNA synthetase
LWESIGGEGLCSLAQWPAYDEAKTKDAEVELAVQVNGKLRGTITVDAAADKDTVLAIAKADERISACLEGKTVVKEIVVPGKIVNIVVK